MIKRHLFLSVIAALLAAASPGCIQKVEPDRSERIAFLYREEESVAVYTVDRRGNDLQPLVSLDLQGSSEQRLDFIPVSVSRNGMFIAWIDYLQGSLFPGVLYVVDLSQSKTNVLTEVALGDPLSNIIQWSPDNAMLAFCEASEDANKIGTIKVLFTETFQVDELDPTISNPICGEQAWSHDSRYLAVVADKEVLIYEMPSRVKVWQSNLSSTAPGPVSYICNLSWSPDSTWLVFVTGCAEGRTPFFQEDWHEAYVVTVEGTRMQSATEVMQADDIGQLYVHLQPLWSSDGNLAVLFAIMPTFRNPNKEQLPTQAGYIEFDVNSGVKLRTDSSFKLPYASFHEMPKRSDDGQVIWHSLEGWQFASFVDSFTVASPQALNIPTGCWPEWSAQDPLFAFTASDSPDSCNGTNRDVYVFNYLSQEAVNLTDSLEGDARFLTWYVK